MKKFINKIGDFIIDLMAASLYVLFPLAALCGFIAGTFNKFKNKLKRKNL